MKTEHEMKRRELIEEISKKMGKPFEEAEALYEEVIQSMEGILREGIPIDFGEDFGRLEMRELAEDHHKTVVFKASRRFRKIINNKAERAEEESGISV